MAYRKNSEKSSGKGSAAPKNPATPVSSPGAPAKPKPRPGSKSTPTPLRDALQTPTRRLSGYARLTWLYDQLKAGERWNKSQLEKEFGISRTPLKRLLKAFQVDFQQELGFDPRRNSYYLIDASKSLPHIPATEGELFTLLMAQEALGAHQDSACARSLQGAIDKLAASVNRSLGGGLAELRKSICFRTLGGSVRHSALCFDTAAEALRARRELFFDYRSHKRTKPALWKFWPRCLVRQDGVWYLMGHRGSLKQAYTLSLSRMSNLRLGDKTFEPEPVEGPTLRESLASSIGIFGGKPELVRLRFQGVAARLVGEMALHESQEMEPVGEDGLELTMEVAVNPELERWILGWGEQAEVMESSALRDKIAARLRQTAALYENPPAAPVSARKARPEAAPAPANAA